MNILCTTLCSKSAGKHFNGVNGYQLRVDIHRKSVIPPSSGTWNKADVHVYGSTKEMLKLNESGYHY